MLLNTPKKVLLAMAQVYSDYPALFTQGTFARDRGGKQVPPFSSDAVCFCAEGFLKRLPIEGAATRRSCVKARSLMENSAPKAYGSFRVIKINEHLGRKAIIQLALDTAAKIKE